MKSLPAFFLGLLLIAPAWAAEVTRSDLDSRPMDSPQAVAVPEPAAALLGAMGTLVLLRRRRMR